MTAELFLRYRRIEKEFNAARSLLNSLQARINDAEFGITRSVRFEGDPPPGFSENRIIQIPSGHSALDNSRYAGAEWSASYDADPAGTLAQYATLREQYLAAKLDFERMTAEKAAAWKEFQKAKIVLTVTQLAEIGEVNVSYVRADIAAGRLIARKLGDSPKSPHMITGFDALGWLDKPRRGSRGKKQSNEQPQGE